MWMYFYMCLSMLRSRSQGQSSQAEQRQEPCLEKTRHSSRPQVSRGVDWERRHTCHCNDGKALICKGSTTSPVASFWSSRTRFAMPEDMRHAVVMEILRYDVFDHPRYGLIKVGMLGCSVQLNIIYTRIYIYITYKWII